METLTGETAMPRDRYATPAHDEVFGQLLLCWRHLSDVDQTGIDPAQVEPKEKLLHRCADMLEIYGLHVDRAKLQAGLVAERPAGFKPTVRHAKRTRMFMPPQVA